MHLLLLSAASLTRGLRNASRLEYFCSSKRGSQFYQILLQKPIVLRRFRSVPNGTQRAVPASSRQSSNSVCFTTKLARRLRNTGSSSVSAPLSPCPLFHSSALHSTLLHSVMCLSSRDTARSKNVLPANVSEESAAEAALRLGRRFCLRPPPILPDPHTKTLENTAYLAHFAQNSLFFLTFPTSQEAACARNVEPANVSEQFPSCSIL